MTTGTPGDHTPVASFEPRLARVEAILESVTTDISALTSAVRTQGENASAQLTQLQVAVTQAAGPRKTEWSTVVAAVALILAIGAAAFAPVVLRVDELARALASLSNDHKEHTAQPMHAVGAARVDWLERDTARMTQINRDALLALDEKLKAETRLAAASIAEKTAALRAEFDDVRINGSPVTRDRLVKLETQITLILNELKLAPKEQTK